jgi:hypothetical protein
MTSFGLRYERLLVLSAPVSAAALFVLAVATASSNQNELVLATCYETAADSIEAHKYELDPQWALKPVKKDPFWDINYISKVRQSIIRPTSGKCFSTLLEQSDQRFRGAPSDIVSNLRRDAENLRKTPMKLLGVEMPATVEVGLIGIKFNVQLMSIARALQIVLAPILLLWLSSLYHTRYREAVTLASAKSITEAFPHVINVYPVGEISSPRKRAWYAAHINVLIGSIYALIRIFLLLIFIGPPVAAYIASLAISYTEEYFFYFFILGIVVGVFGLANVLGEIYPWHSLKIFRPPEKYRLDRR